MGNQESQQDHEVIVRWREVLAGWWRWIKDLKERKFYVPLGIITAISALFALSAYTEYRTNLGAMTLGDFLVKSNSGRHRVGSLWRRVAKMEIVKQSLDTLEVPTRKSRLPEAIVTARFDIDRVPQDGIPAFLAIWRTPLSTEDHRSMPEVTESVRIYKLGMSLVEAIELPNVRYLSSARDQINSLYRQTGEIKWGENDSLGVAEIDTIQSAVNEALSRVFIDQLKAEEHKALIEAYGIGRVSQMILQRGAGVYLGQVTYSSIEEPPITFEISHEKFIRALGLSQSGDWDGL